MDDTASRIVDPLGTRVTDAVIGDELDLESVRIPFVLEFENCEFAAPIKLLQAESRALEFKRCSLTGIIADRLICHGSIFISQCTADAEVRFLAATIAGDLSCSGSTFNGLWLDQIDVKGKVLLDDGFVCRGAVRLPNARIRHNLGCRNALFDSSKESATEAQEERHHPNDDAAEVETDDRSEEDALVASGIHVGGDVCLDTGFRATGALLLQRAEIAGSLQCDGGVIESPGGHALSAIFASIGKEVRLGDGFAASGAVDFTGASVRGQFNGEGARFVGNGVDSLILAGAHIEGLLVLKNATVSGRFDLSGLRLDSDCVCSLMSFVHRNAVAIFADRAAIAGSVVFSDCRVAGGVSFAIVSVGNQFVLDGVRLLHRDTALTAQGLTVQRGVVFTGLWSYGSVELDYSTINLGFTCIQGNVSNRTATAMSLQGATITGDMTVSETKFKGDIRAESLRVEGNVRFRNVDINNYEEITARSAWHISFESASVRGNFEWCDISMSDVTHLSLAGARVGTLSDDMQSWPASGRLDLRDFHYNHLLDTVAQRSERLAWLERQSPDSFSLQPYQELIAWARRVGDERDATRFAIARENALRRHGRLGVLHHAWNWFIGVSMAHGYAPLRLLYAALVFVLVGWGLFGYGFARGAILQSKYEEPLAASRPSAYPAFSPFAYSVDTFLPIIDFYQESYWIPNTNASPGRELMTYLRVHIAMGWAISTLAVIGFSGLVRKD